MATQLLVNVIEVTALAAGASVTLPHGIRESDKPAAPKLVFPDRGTPIRVAAVTTTTVTFTNDGTNPETAKFRCEHGLSNEVEYSTLGTMFYQGIAAAIGGGTPAGLVPVPAGSPVFADGQIVAINSSGALVLANAVNLTSAPAVGVYMTVAGTPYIRVAGEHSSGLAGLVAGTLYYPSAVTPGALSASSPAGPGAVVQVIGRATSTTSLFVSPTVIVTN